MTMRLYIDIITEAQRLAEQARADLYHATTLSGAIGILTAGAIRPHDDGGWFGYDGKDIIPVSRDERYRFSGGGYQDENNNPVVEGGHGPVQFVLDTDAVRQRFSVSPYDHAQGRFRTYRHEDDDKPEDDQEDPYGHWSLSHNLRRKESEERIHIPKGKALPLDGMVKAIILEPITQDWLRFHHRKEDRAHLVGSGNEKEFAYVQKANRYDHGASRRMDTDWGRDYTGVDPKVYGRIIMLAKRRGIPVIDRRKG